MKTGSTNITERVGRTVLYTLNEQDARAIMQRRIQLGTMNASANDVHDGDTYPAIIVRDFGLSGTPQAQADRTHALERTLSARYRKSQGQTDPEAAAEPGWPSVISDMNETEFARYKAQEIESAQKTWAAQARQSSVNLRVILDGYDEYWATSRSQFDPTTHGRHVPNIDVSDDGKVVQGPWETDSRGHWQPLT